MISKINAEQANANLVIFIHAVWQMIPPTFSNIHTHVHALPFKRSIHTQLRIEMLHQHGQSFYYILSRELLKPVFGVGYSVFTRS